MNQSISGQRRIPEELQALRQLIAHLAPQCQLDLADKHAVRRFLDAAPGLNDTTYANHEASRELRAMLVLLFRLEASSSEDLGVEGLRRLWRQHNETLARFAIPEPPFFAPQAGRQPHA